MQNIIRVENVTFSRGHRAIYDDVSMEFPKGKIIAILGPSGCGKTTLLRMIGGQLQPESGNVWVGDQNIPSLSHRELYKVRRIMGMLFQSGALFTDMSVFDNVAFPLRQHTNLPPGMVRTIVLMKLEAVGLRGAADLMPSQLSGGMARRVALARTIALDPSVIMYDEPFAGQDPISMGVLVSLIRQLNDTLGMTSIIVSHDVNETMSIADFIYVVSGGKVVGKGTPSELKASSDPWVKQFIMALPDGPVPFHYPAQERADDFLEELK